MNNSVWVIWKEPKNRRNYIVGTVEKVSDGYNFFYANNIKEIEKVGFSLFIPFNNRYNIYHSNTLFPIFSSRLPDKKRRDINKILQKYNMEGYDEFELLKKGAELPVDNIKFVPAVYNISDLKELDIPVSGTRHYLNCELQNCTNDCGIQDGDYAELEKEPDNEADEYAIKVIVSGIMIGYIPRFYNKVLWDYLIDNDVSCRVSELNKSNIENCIKIKIEDLKKTPH